MSIAIQASDILTKAHRENDPISTFGSVDVYIALHYRRLGELIELTATLVHCLPSGRSDVEEIDRAVTTDQDEALMTAVDLEHAGAKRLRELDIEDEGSQPCDFETALIRLFEREERQFAIAAE